MDPNHPDFPRSYGSEMEKDYGVRLFWEIDTAPLQDPSQAATIFQKITESLKKADPNCFLSMVTIYGDFSKIEGGTGIFKQGDFTFDLRVCDLPWRFSYCTHDSSPACRDDPDFQRVIASLEDYGFVMMLASRSIAVPTLGRRAYYMWDWENMIEGGPPRDPSLHYKGTLKP